jgi:hypothetical protein
MLLHFLEGVTGGKDITAVKAATPRKEYAEREAADLS